MRNFKFKISNLKSLGMIFLLLLLVLGCEKADKPAVNGKGALSLEVAKGTDISPWHHMPADKWRASHMDFISSGKASQNSCLLCHAEPDKFCNKCHEYVGVKKVAFENTDVKKLLALEVAEGLQPTPDHAPLQEWRIKHDNAILSGQAQLTACLGCHFEPDKFCNKCHATSGIRKISAN
jgi:hypothetical protein